MEAKDTVMSYEELVKAIGFRTFTPKEGREAQAEISFKAGIREVVEWMEGYYSGLLNQYSGHNQYLIPRKEREAKLKEWGMIKEE